MRLLSPSASLGCPPAPSLADRGSDFRILDLILFINDFFSPEPPDEVTVSFYFAWVSACASSKALLTSFISFHCLLAANPMVMMSCPVLLSISSNLSLLTLEYSQNYPLVEVNQAIS